MDGFIVLDFGSQLTQLIARRLREIGVYSEIHPFNYPTSKIKERKPKGIIISGGPNSVYGENSPLRDVKELFEIAPVLGICYGMQLITHQLGGKVETSDTREYGLNTINWNSSLISEIPKEQKVWMSHGDVITDLAPGFKLLAESGSNHPAVIKSEQALCFQFHPEVAHTEYGTELIKHFVVDMCKASPSWEPESIITQLEEQVRALVPAGEKVLCALSGGVDSTVVGVLLTKVLGGENVKCVFVDTGLLRKNEFQDVLDLYAELGLNVKGVQAHEQFLGLLAGVSDPEKKRKIIGKTFIDVFKESIKDMGKVEWLAQGTLYPDVIESVSPNGQSVTIKSHHNVGGLPKDLNLKLVEPLRELFKDEVRKIGPHLGIPDKFLWRHPFPGPGLAIRILGAITPEDVKTMQDCDAIFIEELKKHNLYDKIWQAFCVLLPVKTVGVQGDARTYEKVLALRSVTSSDGMTADWYHFSPEFLTHVSNRITNEVKHVNRVVYDITSKPPGTIEWE